MKAQISTLLKIDEVLFDDQQTEKYLRWCMNLAKVNNVPLQPVLANAAINRYYNYEFGKLESNFLQIIKGKEKYMSQESLHSLYSILIVDIFKLNPKPLIEEAKKLTIINPPINSN